MGERSRLPAAQVGVSGLAAPLVPPPLGHTGVTFSAWASLLSPDSMDTSTGMSEGLQPSLLNHVHPFSPQICPLLCASQHPAAPCKLRSRLSGQEHTEQSWTPISPLPPPHPGQACPLHRELLDLPTPSTPAPSPARPWHPLSHLDHPSGPPFPGCSPLSSRGRLKHRFSIKALLQLTTWASSAGHHCVFKAPCNLRLGLLLQPFLLVSSLTGGPRPANELPPNFLKVPGYLLWASP